MSLHLPEVQIFFSALGFQNALIVWSSVRARHHVSHPYKVYTSVACLK